MKELCHALILALVSASTFTAAAGSFETQRLVEIAKRHSLPMPPPEARLVLAHTLRWGMLGNQSTSRDPGIYSPAYLLEDRPDGSIVVR